MWMYRISRYLGDFPATEVSVTFTNQKPKKQTAKAWRTQHRETRIAVCLPRGGRWDGGNGATSVPLPPWRRAPARHSPRCTACSCGMLLLYLLPHVGQHTHAPCRGVRPRRRRRSRTRVPPPMLDSGALRSGSRNTRRSGARNRLCQMYAQGSPGSWALHCGIFAALAWRKFTRNGSGWRPPLPPPQKQPLSGSVPFAHAVCIRHRCVRTCACFSGGRGHKSP